MILVLGPESSGGQWLASMIRLHPDAPYVEQNSYPAGWGNECIMPDYTDRPEFTDLVIPLRDVNIVLKSQRRLGYLSDHPSRLTDTHNIRDAIIAEMRDRRVHFVAYAGLVGWFSREVFTDLLNRLKLEPELFPWRRFNPVDGNAKYIV